MHLANCGGVDCHGFSEIVSTAPLQGYREAHHCDHATGSRSCCHLKTESEPLGDLRKADRASDFFAYVVADATQGGCMSFDRAARAEHFSDTELIHVGCAVACCSAVRRPRGTG